MKTPLLFWADHLTVDFFFILSRSFPPPMGDERLRINTHVGVLRCQEPPRAASPGRVCLPRAGIAR